MTLKSLFTRPAAGSPKRVLQDAWRAAAGRLVLTEIEESEERSVGPWLSGCSGRLSVRLDGYRLGSRWATHITVTGLWPAGQGLRIHRAPAAHDQRIGAPAFDQELWIEGQAPLALAVFDDPTRWQLAELLRGYIALEGREWEEVSAHLDGQRLGVSVPLLDGADADRFADMLGRVLDLARRLATPADIPARIAQNFRSEHEAGVRLRGVLVLAREFPNHPATRDALLAAREDPDGEVRLQAGWYLGEEGGATLLALVESARTEDSCAARAVNALGERLPAGQAEAALGRALERGRSETARACLAALERRGALPSEGLLLQALGGDDLQISVTAARALGRVGTVTAVTALRAAESSRRGELRSAARQAIAEIQSRLPGAQPGQLSLAGSEAGALSLAPGEPGRLSLSEPGPVHPHLHAAEPKPVLSQEQELRQPTELEGRLA
jgi:hypothetical protein